MNKLKEKYYIALGNLQNMAIDNTKGSKGVDICVLDINEYTAYLQSKIDKVIEYCEEVIKEHNNGEYNVSTVELAVKEHKENIENVLDILKEDK